jgi:hypothetical protein
MWWLAISINIALSCADLSRGLSAMGVSLVCSMVAVEVGGCCVFPPFGVCFCCSGPFQAMSICRRVE